MTPLEELRVALDDRAADLGAIERTEEGGTIEFRVGTGPVCVVGRDAVEFRLGDAIARAALRTPDVAVSRRGSDWVRFAPSAVDRFALDRAIAWFEFATRDAGARTQA